MEALSLDLKGDKTKKQEKGRKDDKSKRSSGVKGTRGKKPGTTRQQHRASENGIKKRESISNLLQDALKQFPDICTEQCDPDKCDKACDVSRGQQELHKFEALFKTRLKEETKKAEEREQNLLHLLVKDERWKSEHKTVPKRMFNWMLRQQENLYEGLLKLGDNRGLTPVHNALYDKVHDFIDAILEAEGLNTVNILKKTDSADKSCIHLATQEASPHLSTMIRKCNGDKEIFTDGQRTEKGTPLHVAVQEVLIPVFEEDEDTESDVDSEGAGLEDNNDHQKEVMDDQLDDGNRVDSERGNHDDSDESDDLDFRGSSMSEFAEDSDYEDSELEEAKYRLEDAAERERRLQKILDCLDEKQKLLDKKQTTKPRPPPRVQDSTLGNPHHMSALDDGIDHMKANDDSSFSELTMGQDLPHDHSVRLLVEACPGALMAKNKLERTPYQEREHILLNDNVVRRLVDLYANKKKDSPGETIETRAARAKRAIIVEDPVARYIRSYCIRESRSREETMQQLYKPGQERHIEFDLEGFPSDSIKHDYLDKLGKHLQFESILRYVALPVLSVEPPPPMDPRIHRKQFLSPETHYDLHRNGRSDLVTVFDWLWDKGVREIVKVRVVDGDLPHADASIVEALYGFNVQMWDWKRVDLCSDVICESSQVIKEVSIYSSGNNAVLMGWASEDGLGNREKFPYLEKVNLLVQDGLEDDKRWQSNNRLCQKKIREQWLKGRNGHSGKELEFRIIVDHNQGRSTTENIEQSPEWINSTRKFATFLMNASKDHMQETGQRVPPVKIAIIDDGIDATLHDLQSKIAGGATFCPYPHSSELVNSYFVPRGKHGTQMAQLICNLCPGTELFIARLEELPLLSGSGRRVTARSAAKAIEWAVNCGVDIISMSWTIQTTANDSEDMTRLKKALDSANTANIHMFGSANDQGASTKEEYYPSQNECIRIGGATFTGEKLTWVDDKVDFWFPGRNVPFLSRDGKSVVYDSGSSIATAAASGLAGLLIFGARLSSLVTDKKNPPSFHTRTAMATAFGVMAVGGKFPRTDDILNKLFKKKVQQATQKVPKSLDIATLDWSEKSKAALELLLLHIQGS